MADTTSDTCAVEVSSPRGLFFTLNGTLQSLFAGAPREHLTLYIYSYSRIPNPNPNSGQKHEEEERRDKRYFGLQKTLRDGGDGEHTWPDA